MADAFLGRILAEVGEVVGAHADGTVEDAISVAIFVEDALGIVLPDELITAENMGSVEAIERSVAVARGRQ